RTAPAPPAPRPPPPCATAGSGTAIAADPDVALEIDENPVVRFRPVVALAGAAPVADEIAGFVELENGRGRHTAFSLHYTRATLGTRGIRCAVVFHGFERGLAVDNPDVIVRIHTDADRVAENPVVRQRLRP